MSDRLVMPDFERPPVVETVLSVRFRDSASLTTARAIQFWGAELVDRFPDVEEHPPYEAPIERVESGAKSGGRPLRLRTGFPAPRFWFRGGSELVQLQPDWLAFNWRQVDGDEEYVRYSRTRERFAEIATKLQRFMEEHDGKFEPIQCEVTYINHIVLDDSDLTSGPLGQVLRGVTAHGDRALPPPEIARFATSYIMHGDDDGEVTGRLHVVAESTDSLGRPPKPGVILNLTARGRPGGAGLDGALAFCDAGRRWVVGGFADLTTPLMHRRWGLKGAS